MLSMDWQKNLFKIKIDFNHGKLIGKSLTHPARLAVHSRRFRGCTNRQAYARKTISLKAITHNVNTSV